MGTAGRGVLGTVNPGKGAIKPNGKLALFDAGGAACDCCSDSCDPTKSVGMHTSFETTPDHPGVALTLSNGPGPGADLWDSFISEPLLATKSTGFGTTPSLGFANWNYTFVHQNATIDNIEFEGNFEMAWNYASLFSFRNLRAIIGGMNTRVGSGSGTVYVEWYSTLSGGAWVKRTQIQTTQNVVLSGWVTPLNIRSVAQVISSTQFSRTLIINGVSYAGGNGTNGTAFSIYRPGIDCFAHDPSVQIDAANSNQDTFKSISVVDIALRFNGTSTLI